MSELTHSLVINEVMQSVTRGDVDKLNEYPDGWVELYNPTGSDVTLTGYVLSEKKDPGKGYKIPKATQKVIDNDWWGNPVGEHWQTTSNNIKVPKNGYIVIYCDNEAVTCEKEVHTDFRMPNAKGGTLYLYDGSGKTAKLVDSLYLPPMPATDVAYGRKTDGAGETGYMLTPTKGKMNSGGFAKMVLPEPIITGSRITESQSGSGEIIRVSMSMPEGVPDNAVIRYTLNYSEPTASSARYSEELQISKTTIVRAAIFASGCITPPAATRSYIFLGRKLSVPVVSLVTDKKNLDDSKIGIIANNTTSDDKENWRRPVKMEYFPTGEKVPLLNQGAEIRVSGAYSRANKQKSFIVYANSRFNSGGKDYFEAPFWEFTGSDMTQSPSIGLRSSGNDFNFSQMRDGISQMLFGMNTDLDWQDFQPAITFINGEYYGILNIRERANEDNIWMHYKDADGGRLTDITLIENPWWGSGGLKQGDWGQYNEFKSFLGSSKNKTLSEYEKRMDVVEFTNFMIANIYMSNTDFPGNNYVMWRPVESGGKWRFILKDVDRSLGLCYWHGESSNKAGGGSNAKYLRWILRDPYNVFPNNYDGANSEESTQLLRNLMAIQSYSDKFVDRFTVYLGDFLKADNIASVIDGTAALMSLEMEYHKKKYGGTVNDWRTEIDRMKTWAKERTENMYAQLQDYSKFKLGAPVRTTVNDGASDCGDYVVTINDIPLTTGFFDGKLFTGRKYSIRATRKSGGSDDIGWRVICRDKAGAVLSNIVYDKPLCEITPGSEVKGIEISLIGSISGIEEDYYSMEPVDVRYYNLQGIESSSPFEGMNVIRYTYPDGSVSVRKQMIE